MKNKLLILSIAAAVLLTSCATSISVKVTRPAELNMHGAKTIAVIPFQPSTNHIFRGRGSRHDILAYFMGFRDINPDEKKSIECIDAEIKKILLESDDLTLINSDVVRRELEEGKEPSCDVYLTGQILDYRFGFDEVDVKVNDDEGYHYETNYLSKAKIEILYQIVDARTNEVIAFRQVEYNESSSNYSYRSDCPKGYELLRIDLKNLARKISKQIQPYDVYVSLTLLDDKEKNEENKIANELADNGLIMESYNRYSDFYEKTGNFVAGYNSALLLQALGELEDAERLMSKLVNDTADKRAISALRNIQYEIDQQNRLQSQRDAQNK